MKYNPAGTIIIIGLSLAAMDAAQAAASSPDRWEDSLSLIIRDSRTQQLPLEPLDNKIREGRAKNRPAAEIYTVVKARQKHLMHIRNNQQGTFSPGYTKQLFDLERSAAPATQLAKQRVTPSPQPHTPTPATSAKAVPVNKSAPIDAASEKKTIDKPAIAENSNNTRHAGQQLIKADKKAGKVMKKTISRADKRMKTIEKQLQKRATKHLGAGK